MSKLFVSFCAEFQDEKKRRLAMFRLDLSMHSQFEIKSIGSVFRSIKFKMSGKQSTIFGIQ